MRPGQHDSTVRFACGGPHALHGRVEIVNRLLRIGRRILDAKTREARSNRGAHGQRAILGCGPEAVFQVAVYGQTRDTREQRRMGDRLVP